MQTMTYESQQKTVESWLAAFRQITEICPHLYRYGSGSSYETVTDYRPDFDMSLKQLLPHADSVTVVIAELFNYGQPHLVTPYWDIWTSNFFRVRFQIRRSYTQYSWERGEVRTDSDGKVTETIPAQMVEHGQDFITLYCECGYGLGDWNQKHDEIVHLCDACRPEVRDHYREEVKTADLRITKWKEALSKASAIVENCP